MMPGRVREGSDRGKFRQLRPTEASIRSKKKKRLTNSFHGGVLPQCPITLKRMQDTRPLKSRSEIPGWEG